MSISIVSSPIFVTLILIMLAVLFIKYWQRLKIREQIVLERKERGEKEYQRKLLIKQHEMGEALYFELKQASAQNEMVNVLPEGTVAKNVGKIDVKYFDQDNKIGYLIVLSVSDPTCFNRGDSNYVGHPVLQVIINLEMVGAEIHVLKGTRGPERNYSFAEFDIFRIRLYKYVKMFRLYDQSHVDDSIFLSQ